MPEEFFIVNAIIFALGRFLNVKIVESIVVIESVFKIHKLFFCNILKPRFKLCLLFLSV